MQVRDFENANNTDFGYWNVLEILIKYKFIFLIIILTVLGLSQIISLRKPQIFQSSMELLVEPNSPEKDPVPLVKTNESNTSEKSSTDFATQLALMRSRLFIETLTKNLKPKYPQISIDEIQNSLTIEKVFENKDPTNIIKVTFVTNDALKAQKILSALQIIYQNYNSNQQSLKLSEGIRFIDSQLRDIEINIAQNQAKVETFRKNNNLIDPGQQADNVVNSLNTVEQDLRGVQTLREETQAKYDSLQHQLNLSPTRALNSARLTQSARYQKLLGNIKDNDQDLAIKRILFTEDNPEIKNLVDKRKKLLDLLKVENSQILGNYNFSSIALSEKSILKDGQLSAMDLITVSSLNDLKANLDSFKAREAQLLQSRLELRKQLKSFPTLIAEYNRLLPEIELGQSVIKKLLEQRQEISALLSRGGYKWQLVEPPLLGQKMGPNHKKDLLIGLVVGLFLASGTIFILESLNKKIKPASVNNNNDELPFIGSISVIPFTELSTSLKNYSDISNFSCFLISQILNNARFKDSINTIYDNFLSLNSHIQLKTIAITSCLPGEGKTTLSLGLALKFARSNLRILLIDADLSYPSLHEYFNLDNGHGLIDLLNDSNLLPNPYKLSLLGINIDVLTSGSTNEIIDFTELIGSRRMEKLLSKLAVNYDLILIDTSPVCLTDGAIQISSLCSGAILVIQSNNTGELDKSKVIQKLYKTRLLGIVENEFINIFQESKVNSNGFINRSLEERQSV